MNQRTKIYFNFLETLRDRAQMTKQLTFRERLRTEMLRYISSMLEVSSVYCCRHHFAERYSSVQSFYVANMMNASEYETDIGGMFIEQEESEWAGWLHQHHATPRILQTTLLLEDHPEYAEYAGIDISIMFAALYYEERLWGFVEVWDALYHRAYPAEEQALLVQAAALISETILTPTG